MKNILQTLVFSLVILTANSQQTYVPDDNFEQALINLGYDNVLDDSVITANISGISSLVTSGLNIADLTGVEAMVSLTNLECDDNNLTSLDVSSNTLLNWFMCMENQLISIDVSTLSVLGDFDCSYNLLTTLDVSNNTNLIALDCFDNQLVSLDVSNGNNINMGFYCFNNPNLYGICADDSVWATNNWTVSGGNIDVQLSFIANCSTPPPPGQKTFVPDDNFEIYIEGQGWGDGLMNDSVLTSIINSIDSLNVGNLNITDLTGLEDFISISYLNVDDNPIASIDISNNLYLTYFYCRSNGLLSVDISNNTQLYFVNFRSNQLTQLDVSNNYNLGVLIFDENQMASIDISNNTNLVYIGFQVNQLVSLDVSNNPWLQEIHCWDNQITSLDLSNNTWLKDLNCEGNQLISLDIRNGVNSQMNEFEISYNSYLECISVDDSSWATTNWTVANGNIDPQHYFFNNCDGTTDIAVLEQGERKLLKVVNILGEKVSILKENQIYFYIYDEGTVSKQLNIK